MKAALQVAAAVRDEHMEELRVAATMAAHNHAISEHVANRRTAKRCHARTLKEAGLVAQGDDNVLPARLSPEAFNRPAGGPASLVAKYRPLYLAEVLGQPEVTASLAAFVKAPVSCAMVFHGESGCGKTSAAQAIARELGCSIEDEEMGGYFEIASGEMTAEQVRDKINLLRYRPLTGSGWRVLIANECDRMQRPAETIWLDALENLPPQTVVIFTTNEPQRLSQRFLGRCETYAFQSDKTAIRPWIHALAIRIWNLEVGPGSPPNLAKIGMPMLGDLESMHASFRLALQQLQPLVRSAKSAERK
jgi:hypothetical protein